MPAIHFAPESELLRIGAEKSSAASARVAERLLAVSWFELAARTPPQGTHPPAGFYSYHDRQIYLLDHADLGRGEGGFITLVHELVHAAQDAEGALSTKRDDVVDYDAFLASRAVLEGEARYYADLVWSATRGVPTDTQRSNYANEVTMAEATVLNAENVFRQTSELFELPYGTRWAAYDKLLDSRLASLRGRASAAPETTCELLGASCAAHDSTFNWPSELTHSVFGSSAKPVLSFSEKLGHWAARVLLLRALHDAETAAAIWGQLQAENFAVYELEGEPRLAVWAMQLGSESAARQAQSQFASAGLTAKNESQLFRVEARLFWFGSAVQVPSQLVNEVLGREPF